MNWTAFGSVIALMLLVSAGLQIRNLKLAIDNLEVVIDLKESKITDLETRIINDQLRIRQLEQDTLACMDKYSSDLNQARIEVEARDKSLASLRKTLKEERLRYETIFSDGGTCDDWGSQEVCPEVVELLRGAMDK